MQESRQAGGFNRKALVPNVLRLIFKKFTLVV